MSNAHCITCWVTKFWFSVSFWERNISIRHSDSKCVAAAVNDDRLAAMLEWPLSSGNRRTMSVTARTIRSEHGIKDSNWNEKKNIIEISEGGNFVNKICLNLNYCFFYWSFWDPIKLISGAQPLAKLYNKCLFLLFLYYTFSSLALIKSSCIHLVIASVLLTTSSWEGNDSWIFFFILMCFKYILLRYDLF